MTGRRSATMMFPGTPLLPAISFLLIATGASISLLHATEDQTGGAVSEISSAFRAALGQSPNARATTPRAGGEAAVVVQTISGRSGRPGRLVEDNEDWLTAHRVRSEADDGDTIRAKIERDTVAFRNLLGELRRFSEGSATETLCDSIVIEILSTEATDAGMLVNQLGELVRTGCDAAGRAELEFELTLWSSSPSPSAWMRGAADAEILRSQVLSLAIASGLPEPKITSCSRIWLEPDRVRPAATVVVRRIR